MLKKEELPQQWMESITIYVFVYQNDDKTG